MTKLSKHYDIIGDIHGYAQELKTLLARMNYVERGGVYRHPGRTAIFMGDFIDRGPNIRETLQIVRAMIDSGAALAVMGNHEYNALCFDTEDGSGGYLRPHSEKNIRQHRATLDQLARPYPDEWRDYLNWFKQLPLFLDLGELRIVHAWGGVARDPRVECHGFPSPGAQPAAWPSTRLYRPGKRVQIPVAGKSCDRVTIASLASCLPRAV